MKTSGLSILLDTVHAEPLSYTIHDSSSHSGKYVPENIMVDKPDDKTSRWSGVQQSGINAFRQRQWITVKLDRPAVLKEITFGKCSAPRHPCNLKEFKVYSGLDDDHMTEVLHSGLLNDNVPESFSTRNRTNDGVILPCKFVKIVPIAAHTPDYNTSIWYVGLKGVSEPSFAQEVVRQYIKYREDHAFRLIAKHLRSRRLPYIDYLRERRVELEHPTVAQLYEAVVTRGDIPTAESIMQRAAITDNLFDYYKFSSEPTAIWQELEGRAPAARGGHQMALDVANNRIFMFGGWTGKFALADLWEYSISDRTWTLHSHDVSKDGGPSRRNCHGMVYDRGTQCLYILGNYLEPSEAATKGFKSDFWRYAIHPAGGGKWARLSADTQAVGGPPMIFDHNMVVDSSHGIIVVFGGKVIDLEYGRNAAKFKYSGLYTYDIQQNRWKLEFEDPTPTTKEAYLYIPGRVGHGMAFDEATRKVYVFGGYRFVRNLKQFVSDLWAFSLVTKEVIEICSDCSSQGGPDPGFAQRMMIDSDQRELYVMTGLTKDQVFAHDTIRCTLWIYSLKFHKWVKAMEQEEDSGKMDVDGELADEPELPAPRYAHQTIYDPIRRAFFLFGGNDGLDDDSRLGDLWTLALERTQDKDVLRRTKLILRRQRFMELAISGSPVETLQYLQTQVHEIVDHKDPREAEEFHKLAQFLLQKPFLPPPCPSSANLGSSPTISSNTVRSTDVASKHDGTNLPATPMKRGVAMDVDMAGSATASPDVRSSGRITQASGSSFPPPPSPLREDEALPSGLEDGGLERSLATLSGAGDESPSHQSRRSYTPPPAPIMQHQMIPIQSHTGAIAAPIAAKPRFEAPSPPVTSQHAEEKEEEREGEKEWQQRYDTFRALLEFINPEAKEPQTSLVDLITHDRHPEDAARWY